MYLADVRWIDHTDGELKAIISPSQIIGLRFSRVIRGIGAFVLTMRYDDTLWHQFALDDFLEVYAGQSGTLVKQETYYLRGREVYYESSIQQMAFIGVSLNHLLARRTVVPTTSDNTSGGGYSTKAGDAVTVIGEYITDQLISPSDSTRIIPNLSISTTGTASNVGARLRYDNLFDEMVKLAERGGTDFVVTRTTLNNLSVDIGVIGSDKTYTANYPTNGATVFSPDRGNLYNPRFTEDYQDEVNFVYVLGEGEGASQFVYKQPGFTLSLSYYNRIEKTITTRKGEASSISQTEQAITAGVAEIDDKRAKREFTFTLPTEQTYDWELGDLVTVAWLGVSLDLRIMSVEVNLAPTGELTQTVLLQEKPL